MGRQVGARDAQRRRGSQTLADVMATALVKHGYGIVAARRFLDAQGLRLAKGRLKEIFGGSDSVRAQVKAKN